MNRAILFSIIFIFSLNLTAQVEIEDSGEIIIRTKPKLDTPHNRALYNDDSTVEFIGSEKQRSVKQAVQQKSIIKKSNKKISLGDLKQAAKEEGIEIPKRANSIAEARKFLQSVLFDFSKLLKKSLVKKELNKS